MQKIAFVVIVLSMIASPASAWLTSVQYEPAEPIAGEMVVVTVGGYLPDTCWSVTGHACAPPAGQEVVFSVDTYDCGGRGCGVCLAVILPFALDCTTVFPSAGVYEIRVTEYADTLRPSFIPDLVVDVTVTEPVGAVSLAWAAVKCLFR